MPRMRRRPLEGPLDLALPRCLDCRMLLLLSTLETRKAVALNDPTPKISPDAVEALRNAEWAYSCSSVRPDRDSVEWAEMRLAAVYPAIRSSVLEEAFGDEALVVIADFLSSWSFCPVSQSSAPARSCLEDAASQLRDALKAGSLASEGGER